MATVVDTCDGLFGPVVSQHSCRGGFDFTVLFEAWIFNITPAACFLLLLPIRLFQLSRESLKVKSSSTHLATLAIATVLTGIQVVLLVFATQQHPAQYVSLAGATLSLIVAVSIVVLLHLEHSRAVRPSFLVSAYLFITVLLDIARVRTAWLLPYGKAYPACLTASLVTKLLLLVLVNVEKRRWLLPAEKTQSIEGTSGLFSWGLFVWLNELLRRGHTLLLTGDTLPKIHEKLSSSDLSDRFSKSWALCDQSRQHALLLAVINCLRWDIAVITLPRLALIGFSIAQPFLVGKTVTFLEQAESSLNSGYGLIGAIAIVFIGVAVTTASYEHLGFRATTMVRGGLMALVYQHMMELSLGSTDASSVMSLMGAEVEMLAEYFHSTMCESWASILQLGLAAWILKGLANETSVLDGEAFIRYPDLAFCEQTPWLTNTTIRENIIGNNAPAEFDANWYSIVVNACALDPDLKKMPAGDMTLAIARAVYARKRIACFDDTLSALDNATARLVFNNVFEPSGLLRRLGCTIFLATHNVTGMTVILIGAAVALRGQVIPGLLGIALIGMMDLGNVLSDLIQNWTLLETSLGAIARIKDFSEDTPSEEEQGAAYEQQPDPEWPSKGDISFAGADIANESENAEPVLHSISLDIHAGEKVGLCGRTGSGKSTLALPLLRLNEVVSGQILIDGIDISTVPPPLIRHRISSLSQEAFLFPGTIRQNVDPLGIATDIDIIEALKYVEIWNALVSATNSGAHSRVLLDAILTDTTLSEGQKQLFCLARALLKKSNILILDKPTSSLDADTDAKVQKAIRQEFQNCTIIMVAHRVHIMLDFDRVVVLDSGRIIEEGHPSELLANREGMFSSLHHLEQSTGNKQEF